MHCIYFLCGMSFFLVQTAVCAAMTPVETLEGMPLVPKVIFNTNYNSDGVDAAVKGYSAVENDPSCRYETQGNLAQFMSNLTSAARGSMMGLPQQFPFCLENTWVKLEVPCLQPSMGSDISSDPCSLDPSMIKSTELLLQNNICSAACARNKGLQLQYLQQCITKKVQSIQNAMNNYKKMVDANINQQTKDMIVIDQVLRDRNNQKNEIDQILNSDPKTGKIGLVKASELLKQGLAKTQQAVAALGLKQEEAREKESSIRIMQANRVNAQISDCFFTEQQSQYRCASNGPAVSLADYVSCYAKSKSLTQASGRIDLTSGGSQVSKSVADQITSVLNNMKNALSGFDSGAGLGSSVSDKLSSSSSQNIAQIRATYLQQLKNLDRNTRGMGSAAASVADTLLKSCNIRAQNQMNAEIRNPKSTIGVEVASLKKMKTELRQQYENSMQSVRGDFGQVGSAVGVNPSYLYTGTCAQSGQAPYETQMGCLKSMEKEYQNVLSGAGNYAAPKNYQFKGTYDVIKVDRCVGLENCIQQLQTVSQNLVAERVKTQEQKNQYTSNAQAQLNAWVSSVNPTLKSMSSDVQSLMVKMNAALGSLPGGSIINFPGVPSEDFTIGPNGLIKSPQNLMNVLGSHVEPKMINWADATAQGALSQALGKTESSSAQFLGDAQSKLATLKSQIGSCKSRQDQATLDALSQIHSQFLTDAASCRGVQYCHGGNRYTELMASVERIDRHRLRMVGRGSIGSFMSATPDSLSSLRSDIGRVCNPPAERDKKFLEDSKANMQNQCDQYFESLINTSRLLPTSGASENHSKAIRAY